MNRVTEYSFISRSLEYIKQRGWKEEKGFKVLLGVRGLIKRTSYRYSIDRNNFRDKFYGIYFVGKIDEKLFWDARFSKKMKQFKSWSGEVMENEADYDSMENHKEFCDQVFDDGDLDVAKKIEEMSKEAVRRFQLGKAEKQDIVKELEMIGRYDWQIWD